MKPERRFGSKILLLAAAITWSACSNDLIREDVPDKGCTLTVNATKSQVADTRALNLDGNNIAVSWSMDDRVTVLNANNAVIGSMAPTWIEDNKAKLKTTLDGSVHVNAGDQLTLVFPRTGQNYTGQKGTLTDIATNYDYATASVDVKYADNSFVSTTDAHFTTQQAIVRFNLTDGTNPINISELTISADGLLQNATTTGPITITPTNATHEIYAALSGLNGIVKLSASVGDRTYTYTTPDAKRFTNGKFYPVTVKMKKSPVPYPEPLTLESFAYERCKVVVTDYGDLEYSKDGTTWTTYEGQNINLNPGDKVSFRGTDATKDIGSSKYMNILCYDSCYVYGNVMSLLSKDSYATMTELPYNNTFQNLFMGNTYITHADGKDLVLPAKILKPNCYYQMFSGCTSMNYVKCLATDISANRCTYNWLNNTARRGTRTFVKAKGFNGWNTDDYSGIPNGWTIKEE